MTDRTSFRRVGAVFSGFCAVALAIAAPAVAETSAEFAAKRVGPPPQGARRLIHVQIGLVEAVDEEDCGCTASRKLDLVLEKLDGLQPPDVLPDGSAPASDRARFWARLAADRGPGHPAGISAPAAPSSEAMRRLGDLYGAHIQVATEGRRVPPAMALAVMQVESGGRTDAVSPAGAAGVMQLMPATAERFDVEDRHDPGQSIRGGVAYLDWLLKHFNGDPVLALAGYNAGENAVRRHGGVPPYPETRAYVPKVLAAWRVAAGLCRDAGPGSAADPAAACGAQQLAQADP